MQFSIERPEKKLKEGKESVQLECMNRFHFKHSGGAIWESEPGLLAVDDGIFGIQELEFFPTLKQPPDNKLKMAITIQESIFKNKKWTYPNEVYLERSTYNYQGIQAGEGIKISFKIPVIVPAGKWIEILFEFQDFEKNGMIRYTKQGHDPELVHIFNMNIGGKREHNFRVDTVLCPSQLARIGFIRIGKSHPVYTKVAPEQENTLLDRFRNKVLDTLAEFIELF